MDKELAQFESQKAFHAYIASIDSACPIDGAVKPGFTGKKGAQAIMRAVKDRVTILVDGGSVEALKRGYILAGAKVLRYGVDGTVKTGTPGEKFQNQAEEAFAEFDTPKLTAALGFLLSAAPVRGQKPPVQKALAFKVGKDEILARVPDGMAEMAEKAFKKLLKCEKCGHVQGSMIDAEKLIDDRKAARAQKAVETKKANAEHKKASQTVQK